MNTANRGRAGRLLLLGALAVSAGPARAGDVSFPEPGDVSRGAQGWVQHCNRCHIARQPRELRDDQWISTMFHMRVRAGLTGQEMRDILSFMQASN